ncbi:hypothetical protein [Clostridium sp. AM58-1XD]|uniref:hypothetical protein n=1 Tax=Clostridium sp. AM58-1XD TaxID=2292307 RepID=UPI000E522A86|nr:hypothetical protein [Clostridium sp. AM58-1XD]RGZ00623.1 hypothetical protein DXA13_04060 [Clostridium sp. AM58-1XD]
MKIKTRFKSNIFPGLKPSSVMCTAFFTALFSSALFFSTAMAGWESDAETGSRRYQLEDGTFASNQWISSDGSWYYMDEDGCMVSNQSLDINGVCYAFYGDGRLMRNDDITDVELGYLNYYSSTDILCTASSKWANYTLELPGNTNFISYLNLTGRKPIYEFLATIPSTGTLPVSVSSCYFQANEADTDYNDFIIQRCADENFALLSSEPVTLGNEETYQKLSFVYDRDGVYGRPIYRDCYIRKIGDFCPVLTSNMKLRLPGSLLGWLTISPPIADPIPYTSGQRRTSLFL